VCFLLGNSPASEFCMPRRKHTTYRTRRKFEIKNTSWSYSVTGYLFDSTKNGSVSSRQGHGWTHNSHKLLR
jgi:hypothetical protein